MKRKIKTFEEQMEQITQMKTIAEVISDVKNGRYQKHPIILGESEHMLISKIVKSGRKTELINALNTNLGCNVYEFILGTFGDEQLDELIYIHFVMYIDIEEEDGEYKLYRYAVNKKMACKYLLSLESSEETSIAKETTAIIHASLIETFATIDQNQYKSIRVADIDIPESMNHLMNLIEDKGRVFKFINPKKTQFLNYNFLAA